MEFLEKQATGGDYWRSIILFGRNVASYKFALAQALLEFKGRGNDLVALEELALPFARNVCKHLMESPKQSTSTSSRFLEACRNYNGGKITQVDLVETTRRIGFVNVIDAFHVVNNANLPHRFFIDERRETGGIRLTENLFQLLDAPASQDLGLEVEARWNLVETAWDLGISNRLISIGYDPLNGNLFTRPENRRIDVTSCRDALNGYQKGKCFHCFDDISIFPEDDALADVDHYFPHTLRTLVAGFSVNGVWNLVLACKSCNRGHDGKFARVPSLNLLGRLFRRNEFLIGSHHPLRETLMSQTGGTPGARRDFLQARHNEASTALIHHWEPEARGEEVF